MSTRQESHDVIIPGQRCGEWVGHPHSEPGDRIVCVEPSGHDKQRTDHESSDGTRW
jgi:hypothetical protein